MNVGIVAISTALLIVAWRRWLERGEIDKHSVQQGVLLAAVAVAWFFRIVFVG